MTHGSRDLRYQRSIAQLADRVQQKLSAKVGMAVLECAPVELHQQIERFCQRCNPHDEIEIVPLFLLPGVHVKEDIPEQIEIARSRLPVKLSVTPHLGSSDQLTKLLAQRFSSRSADARILLSHGSRRPQGNLPIEQLAEQLAAIAAFWSVPPNLETSVQTLVQQGCQEIAILPYFLFSGGITDAIAQQIDQLSQRFSGINLKLLTPLEVSDDLVDLIVQFIALQNFSKSVIPT